MNLNLNLTPPLIITIIFYVAWTTLMVSALFSGKKTPTNVNVNSLNK